MPLKTLEVLKLMSDSKKSDDTIKDKKIENAVKNELLRKLEEYLSTNDNVKVEISENILPIFINVVANEIEDRYIFEQLDSTIFLFRNKEIIL